MDELIKKATDYAINLLIALPKELLYHNINHTINDVLPAAIKLSIEEGLNEYETFIIKTAVLFHDTGYINGAYNHELTSAEIARESLKKIGYDDSSIELTAELILATRLTNQPKNILEHIMRDADLDNLGRNDFFALDQLYRLELSLTKKEEPTPLKDWFNRSLKFLEKHEYFTKSANNNKNKKKQENILEIKRLLGII